jgi:hypothetical protein
MPGFIADHSDVINALSNVAIVLIWVVYLQLFLITFRRQSRSSIHIDRGVASDEHARCIVTNMGMEPVYLLAVVVDFGGPEAARAVVTDRDELAEQDVAVQLDRTNQGPMAQGEARDVGSLADLMRRARRKLDAKIDRTEIDRMRVTVVAIANQGQKLVAARKDFAAEHRPGGVTIFRPSSALTRQIRSAWRRRHLLDLLETEGAARA